MLEKWLAAPRTVTAEAGRVDDTPEGENEERGEQTLGKHSQRRGRDSTANRTDAEPGCKTRPVRLSGKHRRGAVKQTMRPTTTAAVTVRGDRTGESPITRLPVIRERIVSGRNESRTHTFRLCSEDVK